MQNPETPEEIQIAVDAASAWHRVDAARKYGLIKGGPAVDVERCEEMIAFGESRAIHPQVNAVERLIRELSIED